MFISNKQVLNLLLRVQKEPQEQVQLNRNFFKKKMFLGVAKLKFNSDY